METERSAERGSYGDITVQRLMLEDKPRTQAYKNAIFANKANIEGKIVLDVGCGTGILSIFCAQAGAKAVHAVECSSMARLARSVVCENDMEAIVTVHECKVEDLQLEEKVDVIVSEWMGFYLLHEGMLASVILARDRFLKPSGLMFPETASIWAAACQLPEYFDYWKDVYGVKMECIGQCDRESRLEPAVSIVPVDNIITEPVSLIEYSMKSVSIDDIQKVCGRSLRPALRDGRFQGICLWFHVSFPPCNDEEVLLLTGPGEPDTHWKQTVVILPINSEVTECDPSTFFEVSLSVKENDPTKYNMEVNLLDATEVEHEVPCDCFSVKCSIIRDYIAGESKNGNLEIEGDMDDDMLEEEEPEN